MEDLNQLFNFLGLPTPIPQSHAPASAVFNTDMLKKNVLFVKGDNLNAMLAMKGKLGKDFEFIYGDPPYNTGNSFIYGDRRLTLRPGVWGKHTDWMIFMLPRLFAARQLLSENGVLALSIDDREYHRLKIMMDAVFGEDNCLGTLVVCRSKNGKGASSNIAVNHEYVLMYGKSEAVRLRGVEENNAERYERQDQYGRYSIDGLFRKKGDASLRSDRPNMFYPLYCSRDGGVFTSRVSSDLMEVWPVDSKGIERRWLWGPEKAQAENWRLFSSPRGIVYVKNYHEENKRIKIRSLLDKPEYLTDRATIEVKNIFGEKVFDTPKPISLMQDLIDCCAGESALIMDFFAGTGTTAHAAMHLNMNSPASRQVVLIEHNHTIESKHVAVKRGLFKTSDITEYRLNAMKEMYAGFDFNVIDLDLQNQSCPTKLKTYAFS